MNPEKQTPMTAPEHMVITKVIRAPRALVFSAWTDPVHVAAWWGPDVVTSKVITWDMRPGGTLRLDMHGPNGVVWPMNGTVREVVPPERFVFQSGALDAGGKSLFDVLATATFADQGGETALTLDLQVLRKTPEADRYLKGMKMGWTQSLGRLDAFAAGMR
jgi:uncharacterized protein YndB with AHSA1/START domain